MAARKTGHHRNTAERNSVLRDLLIRELQDLYDADEQLVGAFSVFARAARAKPVVTLCREGSSYTKERIRRLDQVFDLLGAMPSAKRSDGMRGLIRSAQKRVQESRPSPVRDIALIKSVQQISFYGLAGYSTACACARRAGEKNSLKILRKSLTEKRDAVSEEADILRDLIKRAR